MWIKEKLVDSTEIEKYFKKEYVQFIEVLETLMSEIQGIPWI